MASVGTDGQRLALTRQRPASKRSLILLANVLFITATFPNPLALRAAPFPKGGFWVPSFIKGGTGRISPAGSHSSRTPNGNGTNPGHEPRRFMKAASKGAQTRALPEGA